MEHTASAGATATIDGITQRIFNFADQLVDVAADAFAPRLDAQGNIVFGPEATPTSPTGSTVIVQQPSQGNRFNTILIVGAIGLGLVLLFVK